MPNRWIVSSHKFVEHLTPEDAINEAVRLHALTGKDFHVYRIKTKDAPVNGGRDSAPARYEG